VIASAVGSDQVFDFLVGALADKFKRLIGVLDVKV
jgi:hypothetical protein